MGQALDFPHLMTSEHGEFFLATYEAQARVDAELTNGADVTVTGTSAAPHPGRSTVFPGCRA
jgi:hypothetical protein